MKERRGTWKLTMNGVVLHCWSVQMFACLWFLRLINLTKYKIEIKGKQIVVLAGCGTNIRYKPLPFDFSKNNIQILIFSRLCLKMSSVKWCNIYKM